MQHIVFVCEHGAAKSVLAATYFNQLAARSGRLSLHALARGVSPDSEIPPRVAQGLAREGLEPCISTPIALAAEDLVNASLVVTFDQPQVTALVPRPATVIPWNDLPPVSEDFDMARSAILARVQALVTELDTPESAGTI
jgi:protein-tyrosine-phosphatase